MKKEELIQRLMSTFLDEMDEHVSSLNQDLLTLEKIRTPAEQADLLRSLFRTVHSLKGASRSVDLHSVEKTCHQMEELFCNVREGARVLQETDFRALFDAADALLETGTKLRNKDDFADTRLLTVIGALESTLAQSTPVEMSLSILPEETTNAVSASELAPHATPLPTHKENSKVSDEDEGGMAPNEGGTAPLEAMPADQSPTNSNTKQTPRKETGTVRIASNKLDSLLAQSSELLTVYRRTEGWLATISELQEFMKRWQNEFREIEAPLKNCLAEAFADEGDEREVSSQVGRPRVLGVPKTTSENIKATIKQLDRVFAGVQADIRVLNETARQVDEEIRSLRMRPFSEVCLGMERTARDIATSSGKDVQVIVNGADVELDRSVLERLKSPLNHLLRNAVQHGIETREHRHQKNKPETGTITISAALRGSQVEVTVEDDGKGIDFESIKKQARRNNLVEPLTEEDASELIFRPGFSTSPTVNEISGRGVGLDVVASELLALQGSINVSSGADRSGTCFTMTVPLTLTKIRALFVKVAAQTYAFSSSSIEMLLRISPSDIITMQGREVLSVRGRFIPIASLADTLKLANQNDLRSKTILPIVVVRHGNTLRAYAVDDLLVEQEVVVTNLGARLQRVRNISGATLLANGEIALIINAAELVRGVSETSLIKARENNVAEPIKKKRLIVADDSMTTRILESSILEAAGYEVLAVSDGKDAWEILNTKGADLIVSDVEMPIMDGFDLTKAIRSSSQWADLPVILVTGLSRERDRAKGLEVGANAYVVKSDFEQTALLETIAQLV